MLYFITLLEFIRIFYKRFRLQTRETLYICRFFCWNYFYFFYTPRKHFLDFCCFRKETLHAHVMTTGIYKKESESLPLTNRYFPNLTMYSIPTHTTVFFNGNPFATRQCASSNKKKEEIFLKAIKNLANKILNKRNARRRVNDFECMNWDVVGIKVSLSFARDARAQVAHNNL